MKTIRISALLAVLAMIALAAPSAVAQSTKSQLIQIQTQLQLLQDNMARMQQSFDERMGVFTP